MIFTELPLAGAYLIELERQEDERGFFARSWCAEEFAAHGLNPRLVQCNVSYNRDAGTLRGMHYQVPPHEEAKLVRCTRGRLWDVIVDLREGSPTRLHWYGVELSAENHRALYVPEGLAHGFLTFAPGTEVFYQMTGFYAPGSARGFRWDDSALGIDWPAPVHRVSARDQAYPPLDPGHTQPSEPHG